MMVHLSQMHMVSDLCQSLQVGHNVHEQGLMDTARSLLAF